MQSTPPALGHITLLNDVWLFNIHSPFFTMTIMLFTNKGGNHIHDFIIFPTYCSDARGHTVTTSDDPPFPLFIFIISHNRAFSIRSALTVPVAATPFALKCLIKAGLVK